MLRWFRIYYITSASFGQERFLIGSTQGRNEKEALRNFIIPGDKQFQKRIYIAIPFEAEDNH